MMVFLLNSYVATRDSDFNEESFGVATVMMELVFYGGKCFEYLSQQRDNVRIQKGDRKFSEHGKQVKRNISRAIKKGYLDKEKRVSYVPGGF